MEKINVQLYSLGMENTDTMPVSFEKLAKMGYTGVEFAGSNYGGMDVEQMKKLLAENGLAAVSSHVSMENMERDIPYMAALGAKLVICPMHHFSTVEEALKLAELLNKNGKIAAQYGMKVGYHNHTEEFWEIDGKYLLEYVIENTDPETVGFQLDCGWACAAGVNVVEFLNKYPGRFVAIHIKENNEVIGPDKPRPSDFQWPKIEMDENGRPILPPEILKHLQEREKLNCPTGQGIVDWKAVKTAADGQAIEDIVYIVEREWSYNTPQNRLECLEEDCKWVLKNM